MKRWNVLLVTVSCLVLTGCGGMFVKHDQMREITTTIPASTNVIAVPRPEGGTNYIEVVRPAATVTRFITNTIYEPNPAVISTLRTAAEINSFVNPLPFSGAISGLFGLAAVALGFVAKIKTDKAKLLPAIIQGVELANDPKVKESISQVARGLGLEKKLNAAVQEVTR